MLLMVPLPQRLLISRASRSGGQDNRARHEPRTEAALIGARPRPVPAATGRAPRRARTRAGPVRRCASLPSTLPYQNYRTVLGMPPAGTRNL
ncbi:hypothetical protein Stsp01_23420 [Streptomyces sp. NBRC 13847]|nr:hypothetical protein Stsp01_23420 [Streptomyces sp. NBRC 13847]